VRRTATVPRQSRHEKLKRKEKGLEYGQIARLHVETMTCLSPSYTYNVHLGEERGGPPGVVRMKSIAKCNAATLNDIAPVQPIACTINSAARTHSTYFLQTHLLRAIVHMGMRARRGFGRGEVCSGWWHRVPANNNWCCVCVGYDTPSLKKRLPV
jgi:hypothetical protein